MSQDRATAETMFTQWGRWQQGGDGQEVNILWRCIHEGAGASHTTVSGLPHMSATVEVVERFLLTQPTTIRYAVNHRYIYQSPDNYAAKKLKISPDTYRARLDYAASELEKYLIEN